MSKCNNKEEADNYDEKMNLVLIVDDNPRNLQVIGKILSDDSYRIAVANDGEKALNVASKICPDLILLDIMMPGIDGFEVCIRLKADEKTKDIPVIFLTAKMETDDLVKGFKSGGVDYITKPFSKEEVLIRIRTHIDLKNSKELIKAQNDKLHELVSTKDKFFSILAHDLRSNFGSYCMLTELITNKMDELSSEKLRELTTILYTSSRTLYSLLENLLDWARLQTGGLVFKPEVLDISKMAKDAISLFKVKSEEKSLTIESKIPEKTYVYADSNMLATVFRNLISNAAKFSRKTSRILVTSNEKGDFIKISVSDQGIGIKESDISKLFRIDVHITTIGTTQEKGTGLGLILCKEFVEKCGGNIGVESKEGEGSDFFFTLPKAPLRE